MRGNLARVLAALVLLGLAFGLNLRIERRKRKEPLSHSLYLPSGTYLKYASLGFRTVVADALYVWSIQYYSDRRADRWRHLARFYDVITDLDPRFVTSYTIGALILHQEAHEPKHAMALLDKGIQANPDTYLLAWEAAFHAREVGDREAQIRYLRIAMDKPDAPHFVRNWYNFTVAKVGRKEEALRLWRETYASARNDRERGIATRYIRELTVELDLEALGRVIADFRTHNGRNPATFDELRGAGLLREVPLDPDGEPYGYDAATGAAIVVKRSLRERLE